MYTYIYVQLYIYIYTSTHTYTYVCMYIYTTTGSFIHSLLFVHSFTSSFMHSLIYTCVYPTAWHAFSALPSTPGSPQSETPAALRNRRRTRPQPPGSGSRSVRVPSTPVLAAHLGTRPRKLGELCLHSGTPLWGFGVDVRQVLEPILKRNILWLFLCIGSPSCGRLCKQSATI